MSSGLARTALTGYRWAGMVAYPLIGPYLALRAAKGKEDRARRGERFGHASLPRPQGPLIWFHAASVGETNAVVPLIREMRRREINVVLTTGRPSARYSLSLTGLANLIHSLSSHGIRATSKPRPNPGISA